MEHRGTLVKVMDKGGFVIGDSDGARCFLPRSEILGVFPAVGTRLRYDVQLTDRRPLAVGAQRIGSAVKA